MELYLKSMSQFNLSIIIIIVYCKKKKLKNARFKLKSANSCMQEQIVGSSRPVRTTESWMGIVQIDHFSHLAWSLTSF